MGPEAPLVQTTGTLGTWVGRPAPPRPHRRPRPHHHRHGRRAHGALRRAAGRSPVRARDPPPPRPAVLRGAPAGVGRFALRLRGLRRPDRRGHRAGVAVPAAWPRCTASTCWRRSRSVWSAGLGSLVFAATSPPRSGGSSGCVPSSLRPALGGLTLGLLALWSPYALTFGEAQLGGLLTTRLAIGALAVAVMAKLAGTTVTLGSRTGRAASSSRSSSWVRRWARSPTTLVPEPQRAGADGGDDGRPVHRRDQDAARLDPGGDRDGRAPGARRPPSSPRSWRCWSPPRSRSSNPASPERRRPVRTDRPDDRHDREGRP